MTPHLTPRVIVRCHPARMDCVAYLQRLLPPHAEYVWDDGQSGPLPPHGLPVRGARRTLHRALALAGDDAAVHMEDDLWLTRRWWDKVRAALRGHEREVVQFFSMRSADLTVGSRYEPGSKYLMLQCTYLPAGYSRLLLEHYPAWRERNEHRSGGDLFLRDLLKRRRERYWLHVPSLVEHRPVRSVIDPRRSRGRQSKTFVEGVYEL